MSDIFGKELLKERQKVEKMIEQQKDKMKDVKAVAALAKKYNIDTSDLDAIIKIADRVLGTEETK